MTRYAVYWTPEPRHPLWRAGCAWLGRDPAGDLPLLPPRRGVLAPRRYGFHATLKAPMGLRQGANPAAFADAVRALAARTQRFALPALELATLHDFIALCPAAPLAEDHSLRRLADACVRELDGWRDAGNGAGRVAAGLDDEQRALLERWGYPHVFGRWRFHLTLTDSLGPDAPALRERLWRDSRAHFAAALGGAAPPLHCESICVFVEPAPGEPLRLAYRFALAATVG